MRLIDLIKQKSKNSSSDISKGSIKIKTVQDTLTKIPQNDPDADDIKIATGRTDDKNVLVETAKNYSDRDISAEEIEKIQDQNTLFSYLNNNSFSDGLNLIELIKKQIINSNESDNKYIVSVIDNLSKFLEDNPYYISPPDVHFHIVKLLIEVGAIKKLIPFLIEAMERDKERADKWIKKRSPSTFFHRYILFDQAHNEALKAIVNLSIQNFQLIDILFKYLFLVRPEPSFRKLDDDIILNALRKYSVNTKISDKLITLSIQAAWPTRCSYNKYKDFPKNLSAYKIVEEMNLLAYNAVKELCSIISPISSNILYLLSQCDDVIHFTIWEGDYPVDKIADLKSRKNIAINELKKRDYSVYDKKYYTQ